ncbi:MAG: YceD family protein [Gemmatimonas sp.]
MTAQSEHPVRPELSRRIVLATVPEEGETFRLDASAEERAALAKRFDLVDLPALRAEGVLTVSDHGRRARLEGRMRAEVVQSCVVTLEPVPAVIDEPFTLLYSADTDSAASVAVDLDVEDPPEPILGGAVDVGEAVAETLGLSLDPYPRAPGAALEAGPADEGAAGAENRRESPFAALQKLVKKP